MKIIERINKKVLCIFVALTMVFSLLMMNTGVSVHADSAEYNATTKTITFDGSGDLTSETVNAAFTEHSDAENVVITGYTSIQINAFNNNVKLISVTILSTVTSIGNYAFSGCTKLTSVTIPSSVTSIGDAAFYGCSSLTSATIPSSVTSIGNQTFRECTKLTSITIPSSVTSIGNKTFYGCTKLTSVTIPSSVTSIEIMAFQDCTSLTSVTIPSSVTNIKNQAFQGCTKLTSVTIPSSVTSMDDCVFKGCTALQRVEFKGTLSMGSNTFDGVGSAGSETNPILIIPSGWDEAHSYIDNNTKWYGGYFRILTTVSASDFVYDATNGVVSAVTGKDLGAVTTYYKVNNQWTTVKPTAAGTYEVGAVNAGSDTYKATDASSPVTNNWLYVVKKATAPVATTTTVSEWKVGETRVVNDATLKKLTDTTTNWKNKNIHTTKISIPSTVTVDNKTYTITSLKRDCVHGHYVKKLVIPSTVTQLEYACFAGDKHLTSIKINSSKLTLAKNLFRHVSKKQRRKIKVTISKNMSKKKFNAVRIELVKQGLKWSNIKRK